MVVHRLERATDLKSPSLLGRIIAFCGDGDSLTVHQLYEDLFQTSKGLAGSVNFLNSAMEDLSVEEISWTASKASDFSKVEVPRAILVPPPYMARLLHKKSLTPRELWTEVVADIIANGNVGTYTSFVEWARLALTASGGGIRGVLDNLNQHSAMTWKATRLAEDLPGRRTAGVMPLSPFYCTGTKILHNLNAGLEVGVVDVVELPNATKYYMEDLDLEGAELMANTCALNVERLCEYVSAAGGSSAWTRHSLRLADETPLFVHEPPESFVRQHAFASVATLLYSFCPSLFTNGTMLERSHVLADGRPLHIIPDAAIKGHRNMSCVMCMLQLNEQRTQFPKVDKAGLLNSVLFTFMSALSLRENGVTESISIPFVIGVGQYAYLFVTELGNDCEVPSTKLVWETSMRDRSRRAHLFKYLSVLLSRIVKARFRHPAFGYGPKWCRMPDPSPRGVNVQVVGSNPPAVENLLHDCSCTCTVVNFEHSPGLPPPLADSEDSDLKGALGARGDFISGSKPGSASPLDPSSVGGDCDIVCSGAPSSSDDSGLNKAPGTRDDFRSGPKSFHTPPLDPLDRGSSRILAPLFVGSNAPSPFVNVVPKATRTSCDLRSCPKSSATRPPDPSLGGGSRHIFGTLFVGSNAPWYSDVFDPNEALGPCYNLSQIGGGRNHVLDSLFMGSNTAATGAGHEKLMYVFSCAGMVGDLEHPPGLGPWAYCHDSDLKSPLYRIGRVIKGDSQGMQVFVKVWREADRVAKAEAIRTEIRLLKTAHAAGVPCPEVVEHLTALNIDCEYHRLVMKKLPKDVVESWDLEVYAKSLIAAVVSLHNAGILHCDIKPDNVLWDTMNQVAYLVDFGHAQEEEGALSLICTQGYTAPQIWFANAPNTRLTDAYSVGKTLQKLISNLEGYSSFSEKKHQVRRIAEYLCDGKTLEDALTIWDRLPTASGETTASSHPF
jgi:Protein kinase domain